MTDKIAFIGTYGCGKTVLLTVLTQRFRKPTPEGFQIKPANLAAVKFCQEKWDYLKRGEWPAPTPPDPKPPIYKWTLCNGTKEKELITSDIAGEAWRSFIIDNTENSEEMRSAWEKLKQQVKEVRSSLSKEDIETHITAVSNMLMNSTGIFLLLDLSQIINKEPGYEEALYLPNALAKYMKIIGKSHVPITLVLAKTDKYKYLLAKFGSWENVVKEYIPDIRISNLESIVPVAAVADIKEARPAHDFSSTGLEDLYKNIWVTMEQQSVYALLRKAKNFLTDATILAILYGLYLLLYTFSSDTTVCTIFFAITVIGYIAIRVYIAAKKLS